MTNNNISIPSVLSSAAFAICTIIKALSTVFKWGGGADIAFYTALFITLILVAYRSFTQGDYKKATEFGNELKPFSFLASAAFMIEFVKTIIILYRTVDGKRYTPIELAVLIAICLFSLLSSLYLIAISLSCGKTSYDFKRLRFLHFAPLMWALFSIAGIITDAPSFINNGFAILKGFTLIFGALFFYTFIIEIENENGAKKSTVFFSKAFSYLCFLLFITRVFELAGKTAAFDEQSVFALSALLLGLFAHYYRKNLTV